MPAVRVLACTTVVVRATTHGFTTLIAACSVGWFVSLLVREKVLLSGLCERKILFRLEIYDRL